MRLWVFMSWVNQNKVLCNQNHGKRKVVGLADSIACGIGFILCDYNDFIKTFIFCKMILVLYFVSWNNVLQLKFNLFYNACELLKIWESKIICIICRIMQIALVSLQKCSRLMNLFILKGWFVYGFTRCSPSCIQPKFLLHSFLSMALSKRFGLLLVTNFLREICGPMVSSCTHLPIPSSFTVIEVAYHLFNVSLVFRKWLSTSKISLFQVSLDLIMKTFLLKESV